MEPLFEKLCFPINRDLLCGRKIMVVSDAINKNPWLYGNPTPPPDWGKSIGAVCDFAQKLVILRWWTIQLPGIKCTLKLPMLGSYGIQHARKTWELGWSKKENLNFARFASSGILGKIHSWCLSLLQVHEIPRSEKRLSSTVYLWFPLLSTTLKISIENDRNLGPEIAVVRRIQNKSAGKISAFILVSSWAFYLIPPTTDLEVWKCFGQAQPSSAAKHWVSIGVGRTSTGLSLPKSICHAYKSSEGSIKSCNTQHPRECFNPFNWVVWIHLLRTLLRFFHAVSALPLAWRRRASEET